MFPGNYIEIVRQLPPPTNEQTVLFASYVAESHSWYKHLPLYPKYPIYFYLDPHAGESLSISPTEELVYTEITEDSPRFHYTWQTTKDYRQRFGFWHYYAPYGKTDRLGFKGFLTGEAEENVPIEIADLGKVYISALIHPRCKLSLWRNNPQESGLLKFWQDRYPDVLIHPQEQWQLLSAFVSEEVKIYPKLLLDDGENILFHRELGLYSYLWRQNKWCQETIEQPNSNYQNLVELLKAAEIWRSQVQLNLELNSWKEALERDLTQEQNFDEIDLMSVIEDDVLVEIFQSVIEQEEVKRKIAAEQLEFLTQENLLVNMQESLIRIRMGQLDAMKQAMNIFVDAIYS